MRPAEYPLPSPPPSGGGTGAPRRVSFLVLLPLIGFAGLATILFISLAGVHHSQLPSALIGKKVPTFSLPAIAGMDNVAGLSNADLQKGHVTLLNVFASWCVPCREEHPVLMSLAQDAQFQQEGVKLVGMAYKDDAANSRQFLDQSGNPYAQIGSDLAGRVGMDFGVNGVPETFIVKGDGTIAYKFIGPMTPDDLKNVVGPQIAKAMQ